MTSDLKELTKELPRQVREMVRSIEQLIRDAGGIPPGKAAGAERYYKTEDGTVFGLKLIVQRSVDA